MFSKSRLANIALGLGLIACGGCAGPRAASDAVAAPQVFYTVTGEIARQRHQPRLAALQYEAAAIDGTDLDLMAHAIEVTTESLQPSLTAVVAARWISLDPSSLDAHRAAARAALSMQKIPQAAEEYRIALSASPRGVEAEFTDLETEFSSVGNLFGARQVADRLAIAFPKSAAALRLQGSSALRADDPAAAVKSFAAALALTPNESTDARRDITMALWRARILSGDSAAPLADAHGLAERETTPANLLDYALLLLAAQQKEAAIAELETLANRPDTQPVALRLLGLIEFQENKLDAATEHFTNLLATGKFSDDSFYYLGLIAERHGDAEKALQLYAQVQNGDNAVGALLRASSILKAHGAAPAAEELLDRLLEEEPERAPEVLAARARFYADSGDAQQAIGVLERGAAEYPDNVDIRYAIATTYEEHGRVKAALRELEDIVKARPGDPAALNAYGYTLADHNRQLGRARELIERAYSAAPRNPAILDSMGWVLYRQDHDEQALPYLSAAYADDRGADIGAHFGEVLWQLGRRTDAENVWAEASAGDSDNRTLNATRQRLHSAK